MRSLRATQGQISSWRAWLFRLALCNALFGALTTPPGSGPWWINTLLLVLAPPAARLLHGRFLL